MLAINWNAIMGSSINLLKKKVLPFIVDNKIVVVAFFAFNLLALALIKWREGKKPVDGPKKDITPLAKGSPVTDRIDLARQQNQKKPEGPEGLEEETILKQNSAQKQKILVLEEELSEYKNKLQNLEEQKTVNDEQADKFRKETRKIIEEADGLKEEIKRLKEQVRTLSEVQIKSEPSPENDEKLRELQTQLDQAEQLKIKLDQQIVDLKADHETQIKGLSDQLATARQERDAHQSKFVETEKRTQRALENAKTHLVADKDRQIKELESKVQKLEKQLSETKTKAQAVLKRNNSDLELLKKLKETLAKHNPNLEASINLTALVQNADTQKSQIQALTSSKNTLTERVKELEKLNQELRKKIKEQNAAADDTLDRSMSQQGTANKSQSE